VQERRGEYYPTEQLVAAEREDAAGGRSRPHREHTQDQTTGDCAKTERLRNFPRERGRCHAGARYSSLP
jgi:hypothetical protein